MKALAAASCLLVLGTFVSLLMIGCADPPRPANSAQNQPAVSNGDVSNPGAASKDGGGGGW